MKPRILCVDDEPQEQERYHIELDSLYELVEASNKGSALKELRTGTIDAVLMDFQLGMENGVIVTGEIREEGFTQPILICSRDFPGEKIVKLAKEDYGANDFVLKKPENYKLFLEEVLNN